MTKPKKTNITGLRIDTDKKLTKKELTRQLRDYVLNIDIQHFGEFK